MIEEDFFAGVFVAIALCVIIFIFFISPIVYSYGENNGACLERGGERQGDVCVVDNRVVELEYKDE